MKRKPYFSLFIIGLFICFALTIASSQSGRAGVTGVTVSGVKPEASDYTDRMIVVYHDASIVRAAAAGRESARFQSETRLEGMRAKTGINFRHLRFMSGDGQVLHLPRKMTLSEARELASYLMKDPAVKYAEPDARMFPAKVPNDYLYNSQWHYHEATIEPGSVNLPDAWNITTGSPNVVVAVIDTGYLPHEDIDQGRIVPGYDFISGDKWNGSMCFDRASDDDGRDDDPTDAGDWITQAEHNGTDATGGLFKGCPVTNSSWHGTHVAGTIGAHTDNGLGVAGIDWQCKILHARALGKCGGYLSDIVDAIRWSAGIRVDGVPDNKHPAKVLNLSLGAKGKCARTYQSAINDAIGRGAVVVVAAGNENDDMSKYHPANCNGVISVAAVNRKGGKASYSNYGAGVTIAAPGGDALLRNHGILSLLNDGLTVALPDGDTYRPYVGTSMATPHVSGVIALLLSYKPDLTLDQIKERIVSTARDFPTGTGRDCDKSTCGAGIIDATALLGEGNPLPSLISMSPASAWAGGLEFILTVNGENFSRNSVVRWDGEDRQATYVSPTCLEAAISAGDIASAGNYPVSVFTPEPGGGRTNELFFKVLTNPPPSLTSMSPVSVWAGGPEFTLTVHGENFSRNSVVRWDGEDRQTTYISPTRLETAIAAGDIASAGNYPVSVFTPEPGGGRTNELFFEVLTNPLPSLTSMSPVSAWAGGPEFTLTVHGENFSRNSVVRWDGEDRQTTYVSPTCLETAITAGDIASAGNYPVSVFTPAPGGGETKELGFEVKKPAPVVGDDDESEEDCFIATAAFGSPMEKHVRILQDFRDRCLLTNAPGKAFVKFYYEVSPAIAAKISQSTTGRFVTRAALMPLVGAAYITLHGGWPVALLVLVFFVLLSLIMAGKLRSGRRRA